MKYLVLAVALLVSTPAWATVDWEMTFLDPNAVTGNCGNVSLKLVNKSTAGEEVVFHYATAYGTALETIVPNSFIAITLEAGETEIIPVKMIANQRLYARQPDMSMNWSSNDAVFNDSCVDCDNVDLNNPDEIARAVDQCGLELENVEVLGTTKVDFKATVSMRTKQ